VIEVGERSPVAVAVTECERGAHESAAAHAEPSAGQQQLVPTAGLEPLNLECDGSRATFWLDSLRHHKLPTPYRRMGTHAGGSVQARPPDRCKLVPTASGLSAPANPGSAGLLARAGVAMQRAPLDGLVDRRDELAVLGLGGLVVASGDGSFQAAEVGL